MHQRSSPPRATLLSCQYPLRGDEKQDYYFGVNPLQLMAQLDDNDRVNVDGANRALSSFRSLDAVVRNIRKALNG